MTFLPILRRRLAAMATVAGGAFLMFTLLPVAQAARVEETVALPVRVELRHQETLSQTMHVGIFRDDSAPGPQPFLILGHGRPANGNFANFRVDGYRKQIDYFVARGFVVLAPLRIGYGASGGPDVENAGRCNERDFAYSLGVGGQQTAQVLAYARTLPFVDPARGVIAGQSYGGALAIEAASHNPHGVLAAINFAGGGGGDPVNRPGQPCRPDRLEALYADYGKTARIPTLWLYSENDGFWGQDIPQAWFAAFSAQGSPGRFVQLPSVHGAGAGAGHAAFTRIQSQWEPHVGRFLDELGLSAPTPSR